MGHLQLTFRVIEDSGDIIVRGFHCGCRLWLCRLSSPRL